MPHHSAFYHPDLVNASDAVVGKLGYSTVAEAALAGVSYAYVPRNQFRETESFGKFRRTISKWVRHIRDRFFNR